MKVGAETNATASVRGQGPNLVIFILFVVSTFAWIDRSLVPLLIEPIKKDLGLTDTQVSLATGFFFSLAYSMMNVPAGLVIDRVNRRKVLAITSGAWSALLLVCGFTTGFWSLLVARIGIGSAEAFVTPATFSLVADRVPKQKHGWAFSVIGMGPFVGGAIALSGGGALLGWVRRGRFAHTPVLRDLADWQVMFILSGLLTLPMLLLLLLLRPDPKGRRGAASSDPGLGVSAVVQMLQRRPGFYASLILYASCMALLILGITSWTPTMMARKFGLALDVIGIVYGLQGLVFGVGGMLAGGLVIDLFTRRGLSIVHLAAGLVLILACLYTAVPLVTNATLAWTMIGLGAVVAGPLLPIGSVLLARVTPPELMGRMSVAYYLPLGVIGGALGPTLVAILSDTMFSGPLALAHAMSVFALVTGVGTMVFLLCLMAALRRHGREEVAASAQDVAATLLV
ncbi:sugar phosphate permease [Caulobacter sp. AP07]|nr:sugar phosphate permease [Caulobacter sp. AP07]